MRKLLTIKRLLIPVFLCLFVTLAIPPFFLSGRGTSNYFLVPAQHTFLRFSLQFSDSNGWGLISYWKFWCLKLDRCSWGAGEGEYLFEVTPIQFENE